MRVDNVDFFNLPAGELAPKLLGMTLCRDIDGKIVKARILEVEAYCGETDTACHSSKGKTARNKTMWEDGGKIYVYLCYGLHYMFNIVCAGSSPEAVLVRAVENFKGPGVLTKNLLIDKSFDGEDIKTSNRIWIETEDDDFENIDKNCLNLQKNNKKIAKNSKKTAKIIKTARIGIDYASKKDREAKLRFLLEE